MLQVKTDLTIVNGVEHTAAPTILQSSCVGKLYVPQGGSQTNSGHYMVGSIIGIINK